MKQYLSVLTAVCLIGTAAHAVNLGAPVPAEELARRRAALESQHADYDPAEKMVKHHVGNAYNYNYYVRDADVHETRRSLRYAASLLDTYDDAHLSRAQDILIRVIGLQVADPDHQHYGVWPWLMEEPVGEGPYVDRNTADFCGKELLHVITYHRDRLSETVEEEVEASLRRAVEAIRIRNVGAGYTNIAVMGAMVTLLSGEALGDQEITERGLQRVRDLHAYTMRNGTFDEYNSPTYTMVALQDLALFRHQVKHAEARGKIEDLFRVAWETVAWHFHPPTRQWVGPNSRSYSVFMADDTLRFIERWTSDDVDFGYGEIQPIPDLAYMDARCPGDLEVFFAPMHAARTVEQPVQSRGSMPLIATTYLAPEVAVGSINHQDMWNQRRNVTAFWGNPEDPSYCRVRLIYDGYDLATGAIWTQQEGNRVLGVVTFATDGGGKHISLDRLKDATFEAEELSLRFDFGGSAAQDAMTAPKVVSAPIELEFDGIPVRIHVPYAVFDDCKLHWATGRTEEERILKTAFLDLVMHSGSKRAFNLKDIDEAAVAFALQVGNGEFVPATAALEGDMLTVGSGNLGLKVPVRPDTYDALRRAVVQTD